MALAAAKLGQEDLSARGQVPDTALRCVLMDGSRTDRHALRVLAEESRFALDIVETATITETRAALARGTDMLVLNEQVADGDGIEFAGLLAREARHQGIPVIVTSVEATRSKVVRAMRCGAVDFLAKTDLNPDLFDQAVENALRKASEQPADRDARISNLEAENEALRRISLRNMRLLKMQSMPLLAFAWNAVSGKSVDEPARADMARKLKRLTRNMTGLIDDTVILAATHKVNDGAEAVNLDEVVGRLCADRGNELAATQAHIRVRSLPSLTARRTHLEMLIEELLLTAARCVRFGHVPEIEIGSTPDKHGNPVIWVTEKGLPLSARKQAMRQRVADLAEPLEDPSRDEMAWSLCQRLAEKNRGQFRITPQEDGGTRVMIRFPRDMLLHK